jgi:hypothetical protein
MASQFLGLSLFIMLLSFFIILNALSTFETIKSQEILNSLNTSFSLERPVALSAPGKVESFDQSINEGSILDNLQSYFTSQIADVKAKQNRAGTEMHIRMPFDKFQEAIASALTVQKNPDRPDGVDRSFLPTLVSLMDTQNTTPYRMDIMIASPLSPEKLVSEAPEKYKRMSQDVAAIAKKLEDSGMPVKFLSVGIGTGQEGMVDLYFRRHEAFMLSETPAGGQP